MKIDWEMLARVLSENIVEFEMGQESCSTENARQAVELIIGKKALKDAVDYYICGGTGSGLARSVLWLLHPWSAMQHCYHVYKISKDHQARVSAIELLRVVADHRALGWIEEFLDDSNHEIQFWGIGVLDQLMFSELIQVEDAENYLLKAENHYNPNVRERAKFIRDYIGSRLENQQ